MRISPVALLLLPLLLVGCPKKDDKPVDGDKSGSDPKAQGGQAVDGRLLWKNGKVEAHDPTLDHP
ncbi:MAG: hypothetical protein NVSMB47_03830 [Polyangiales bacterium]